MDERIAAGLERIAAALEEGNKDAKAQYARNEETHKDNKEFLPYAIEQSKQSARYFKSSADMHDRFEMNEEERTKIREEKKKALNDSKALNTLDPQP